MGTVVRLQILSGVLWHECWGLWQEAENAGMKCTGKNRKLHMCVWGRQFSFGGGRGNCQQLESP